MHRYPQLGLAITAIAALVLAVLAFPAYADDPDFITTNKPVEKVYDQIFELGAGSALEIDVDDLDVYVKEASGNSARIQVFVAGSDIELAREYFEEVLYFDAAMKNKMLVVESDEPRVHSSRFWNRYRDVRAWAVISVPAKMDANIATEDGDLRIDHLDGNIRVTTEDGDIEALQLQGSVDIESEDGDIVLGAFDADEIFIETTDGDMSAQRLTAERVTLMSTDGDVEIGRIDADKIRIELADGDMDVTASGKELEATCSDGDMTVVLLSEMEVDLDSRDGDILLVIPDNVGADLNLRGDDVSLHGGAHLRGRVSDRSIVGTLNEGGPSVRAKTRDGSIALRIEREG